VSTPGGGEVAAVPLRADAADAVVSRSGLPLGSLPAGARVGTSSPRRASLVRSLRPDVEILPLRGNVDTRVRRVDDGTYDAILLAVAGLERLGLASRIVERLDPRAYPPAPGQGALALQVGDTDTKLRAAVGAIDDARAHAVVSAERCCLRALGGGCSRPIGAYATWVGDELELTGVVGSTDGATIVRAVATGREAAALGERVAADLMAAGAGKLLT
jgi:hydroxymethylbilane synthase